MSNIKISYLYRDAGNYKSFGEVIFDNPDNIQADGIEQLIKEKLIDGQWFYAKEWALPVLYRSMWDDELDHGFHEFEGITTTNEKPHASLSLINFCKLVAKTDWKY